MSSISFVHMHTSIICQLFHFSLVINFSYCFLLPCIITSFFVLVLFWLIVATILGLIFLFFAFIYFCRVLNLYTGNVAVGANDNYGATNFIYSLSPIYMFLTQFVLFSLPFLFIKRERRGETSNHLLGFWLKRMMMPWIWGACQCSLNQRYKVSSFWLKTIRHSESKRKHVKIVNIKKAKGRKSMNVLRIEKW